jgi:hypothetical protein
MKFCTIKLYKFSIVFLLVLSNIIVAASDNKYTFKELFLFKARAIEHSFGLNEKLSYYGFYTRSYNNKINKNMTTFRVIGSSLFLGAAGSGVVYNFNEERITPFICAAGLGTFVLPLMCSTSNCGPTVSLLLTSSFGINLHLIKTKNFNLHTRLGILVGFDIIKASILDSPSDKPALWPALSVIIK